MTDPFVVPELTLGLRNFASPGALGDVHARYFAPLLDARRAATIANRWAARITAFDADRLDAAMRMTLGTFARERYAKSPPDRRALTAQLEDACGDLFDALDDLRVAQQRVLAGQTGSADASQWSAWVACLQNVFSAADSGWEQMQPLLALAPAPSGRRGLRKRGEDVK